MFYLLPVLLTFALGYLSYEIAFRRNPSSILDLLLSLLFGMGVSVQLTFYQIFLFNQYNGGMLILLHGVVLAALLLVRFRIIKPAFVGFSFFNLNFIIFIICFGVFIYLVYLLASINPNGDWDAWAFWNFRAKHLWLSGIHWKDMYTYSFNVKHPSFLSYWIVWQWSWVGMTLTVPMSNAVLFFFLTVALLYYGLREFGSFSKICFLAPLYLCSIPYFIFHSISQYSDILVALYMLAGVLMILKMKQEVGRPAIIGMCCLLGFMAMIKDEGIVASLILLCAVLVRFFRKKNYSYMFLSVSVYFIVLIPVLMSKYWMLGTYVGEINKIDFKGLWEANRYPLIIKYYWKNCTSKDFGGFFIIPVWLVIQRLIGPVNDNFKFLIKFLFCYAVFYFVLYLLAKYDLEWHLTNTADRMIYELAPVLIFLLFYALAPRPHSQE